MKKASFVVAAALTVAWNVTPLTTPASAQDFGVGPMIDFSVGAHAAAQQHVIEDMNKRDTGRSPRGAGRGSRVVKGRGSSTRLRGSTRFRPNLAARRRMVATWTAQTRAANPRIAANLKRDLAGRDPIVALSSNIARYGLRTDDVADVVTVYLVSSWQGIRGDFADPPLAPVRAARAQMRQVLLSNPRFASAPNAVKQQMAEALLLQMVVDSQSVLVARGNPAQMTRARNTIRQNAIRTLKVDLAKMKLTNQGFRL